MPKYTKPKPKHQPTKLAKKPPGHSMMPIGNAFNISFLSKLLDRKADAHEPITDESSKF